LKRFNIWLHKILFSPKKKNFNILKLLTFLQITQSSVQPAKVMLGGYLHWWVGTVRFQFWLVRTKLELGLTDFGNWNLILFFFKRVEKELVSFRCETGTNFFWKKKVTRD